ncbi:hypothetical protein MSG28_012937 [Choristoneura fumiferana]|uniref:Uncharacterized protein n=1 Tax=Choristoneura fumiferana TaxID=7141 RepID=A0ACC0KRE4_CHOFU|nr:hypothetical protein MSG28_012937 [Choristoneura fumiferana]
MHPQQFGFTKGRSTTDAGHSLVKFILQAWEESHDAIGITLDSKLQWGPHVTAIAGRLSSAAFAVWKIRQLTDVATARLKHPLYSLIFASSAPYGADLAQSKQTSLCNPCASAALARVTAARGRGLRALGTLKTSLMEAQAALPQDRERVGNIALKLRALQVDSLDQTPFSQSGKNGSKSSSIGFRGGPYRCPLTPDTGLDRSDTVNRNGSTSALGRASSWTQPLGRRRQWRRLRNTVARPQSGDAEAARLFMPKCTTVMMMMITISHLNTKCERIYVIVQWVPNINVHFSVWVTNVKYWIRTLHKCCTITNRNFPPLPDLSTIEQRPGSDIAGVAVRGNGQATSLEEQITVGGEKSSSGDHEPEDEALAGLPPGGLTTSRPDGLVLLRTPKPVGSVTRVQSAPDDRATSLKRVATSNYYYDNVTGHSPALISATAERAKISDTSFRT